MSSGHAAPTRTADYRGVPEEAAGLPDRAQCHIARINHTLTPALVDDVRIALNKL